MTASRWRSERLKHVADVAFSSVDKKSVDGEVPVRLCNYTDVYHNDEITADVPFMQATASHDQARSLGLQAGDVLITKDSETADDIGVGAFVPETLAGVVCGYHLAVLRPKPQGIDPKYLFWSVCGGGMRQQMTVFASGVTRFGLRFGDVGNLQLFVPDLATQRAIADFLDHETARIDALVERKRKLRGMLAERWEGEIRAIVTGATAGKDDGMRTPWLGQVKADWPVVRLRRLVRFYSGTTFPPDYQGSVEGDYPFVKVADLAYGDGVCSWGAQNWVSGDVATELRARIVPAGSILYPRVGAALLLNQRRIATRDVIVDDNLRGAYFERGDPRYWQALLSLVDFAQLATPGLVPSIGEDAVAAVPVPCPPDQEQRSLADTLEQERARYTALRERLGEQVAALHEHRKGLITTAVTGQIQGGEST